MLNLGLGLGLGRKGSSQDIVEIVNSWYYFSSAGTDPVDWVDMETGGTDEYTWDELSSRITKDLTLDFVWDDDTVSYTDLSNVTKASLYTEAFIDPDVDGIIAESGATGNGFVLYTYDGVLYFQAGAGNAFGDTADRIELEYPISSREYVDIEVAAQVNVGAAMWINRVLVDNATGMTTTYVGGSDAGGIGKSKSSVAVNRGGWVGANAGTYSFGVPYVNFYVGEVPTEFTEL